MPVSRALVCRLAMAAALAGSLTATPAAQRRQPLPDAAVQSSQGSDVKLAELALDGQWLIVYVGGPDSTASSRLLEALSGWDLQQGLARVVVMVGDADLRALQQTWGDRLPQARWVVDPRHDAARALKLRGAPSVVGARGPSLEWILAGVLNDPTMLRDVVRSWLK